MKPYLIWAPPYDRRSGGCKVLHALGHELKNKGVEVYINTSAQRPDWAVGAVTNQQEITAQIERGAIAIYPEIIFGNPFGAKTVVRWMLNKPGKISGPTEYPIEDIVYSYSRIYDVFGLPEDRILFYPQIELNIFYDKKLPRNGVCFYVGKGSSTPRIPETTGALEITRFFPPDQHDLANIFCTRELFISYDTVTSLNDNARLCGCPVILVPGYTSREEMKLDLGWGGTGWGMEELEKAKATLNSDGLRQEYLKLIDTFKERLSRMIEFTQQVAGSRE